MHTFLMFSPIVTYLQLLVMFSWKFSIAVYGHHQRSLQQCTQSQVQRTFCVAINLHLELCVFEAHVQLISSAGSNEANPSEMLQSRHKRVQEDHSSCTKHYGSRRHVLCEYSRPLYMSLQVHCLISYEYACTHTSLALSLLLQLCTNIHKQMSIRIYRKKTMHIRYTDAQICWQKNTERRTVCDETKTTMAGQVTLRLCFNYDNQWDTFYAHFRDRYLFSQLIITEFKSTITGISCVHSI